MKKLKIRGMALMAAVVSGALVGSANAAVIDFESVATGGCQVTAGGSTDGFTLSPYNGTVGAGFNNATACSGVISTANSGSQFMLNFNSVIGEFTKDTGTFTLNSLFVHADERVGATDARFQGLDGIGGNILFTQDVAINSAWQQVNFVGWTGVKTFTWDSVIPGTSNIAIDDFEYNAAAVPVPATAALFGLGLAGLGWSRRRKA